MVLSKIIQDAFEDDEAYLEVLLNIINDEVLEDSSDSELDDRPNKRIKGGGSKPGKAPNLTRQFHEAEERIKRQYFVKGSTYDEKLFRRRFRMKKRLFMRIFEGVQKEDAYFETKTDGLGKRGISGLVKAVAAMKMLAYGVPADMLDDALEMSETSIDKSLERFCKAVIEVLELITSVPIPTSYSQPFTMNV